MLLVSWLPVLSRVPLLSCVPLRLGVVFLLAAILAMCAIFAPSTNGVDGVSGAAFVLGAAVGPGADCWSRVPLVSQVLLLDLGVSECCCFSGAASLQGYTGVLGAAFVLGVTGVSGPLLPWTCSSCRKCHGSRWCLLSHSCPG